MIDFDFKGKGRSLMEDITVSHGRWLATRLAQLSDQQLEDAFRAANYSADEIKLLREGVRERTAELDKVTKTAVAAK
jgi:hypothetical protein